MGTARAMVFIAVVAAVGRVDAVDRKGPCSPEQLHFSAEDETVRYPVSLPDDVLAALRLEDDIAAVLRSQNLSADQLPQSWVPASEVHLDGPNERDLVVAGATLLGGANTSRFWVFRRTVRGHELVFDGAAHDLLIMTKR